MDKVEALKSMLNNLINDKHEEATLDFHSYVTDKMKDVTGISNATTVEDDDFDDIETTEDDTE